MRPHYCSERDIEIYQNPGGLDPYSGESVDIGLFEGPGEVSLHQVADIWLQPTVNGR